MNIRILVLVGIFLAIPMCMTTQQARAQTSTTQTQQTPELRIGEWAEFKDDWLTFRVLLRSSTGSRETFDEVLIFCKNADNTLNWLGKVIAYFTDGSLVIFNCEGNMSGTNFSGTFRLTKNRVAFTLALNELFKYLGSDMDRSDILGIWMMD